MPNEPDSDLLLELECPVCTEYLHPPIRQCATGHSMCDNCFVRLANCPTCRSPKGAARNYTLEKLHAKLNFPCKNRFDGCAAVEKGAKIKEHQEFCQYGRVRCPLSVINDCPWYGQEKSVVAHCQLEHPRNIFVANLQKLTCANFKNFTASTYFYILFKAHDELFKCAWGINTETGMMKWVVYYLGPPKSACRYSFAIEFENGDNHEVTDKIVLKGPVQPFYRGNLQLPSETFTLSNCLLTHYDMVEKFCRGDDLIYTVRIMSDRVEAGPDYFRM